MHKNLLISAALITASTAMSQELPEALFVVGAFNNWEQPAFGGGFPLFDDDRDGVYTGHIYVEANQAEFKIFTSPEGSWEDPSTYIGCEYGVDHFVWAGQPLYVTCSNELKSNITINYWDGGIMEIAATPLENGEWLLKVAGPEQPEYPGYDPIATFCMGFSTPDYPDGYMVYRPMDRTGYQTFEDNYFFSSMEGDPLKINFWGGKIPDRVFYGPENDNEVITPELNVVKNFTGVQKDSFWTVDNWTGGRMKVTADLNTMNFSFEQVENCIYLVGSPQGWDIYSDAMKRVETGGMGQFEGTFTMTEDSPVFRFYMDLGNWDNNSMGSQVIDNPIDLQFEEEVATTTWEWGKGSWRLSGVEGCSLTFKVNYYYPRKVTIINNDFDAAVEMVGVDEEKATYYDLLGNPVANPEKGIFIRKCNGKTVKVAL